MKLIDLDKVSFDDLECGWGCTTDLWCVEEWLKKQPAVNAVEVVQIEEFKQKILAVMDEFIADWLGITQSYADIFRAKIDAMETAKRLVNAALTDLCDNCGIKMDGENK